ALLQSRRRGGPVLRQVRSSSFRCGIDASLKRVFGHIKTLASATIGRALEVDIITQGAAIAFYTIFSIAPIFVLIISISGFFSAEEVITRQIEQRLQSVIGEESATLSRFIQSQLDFQGRIWTTV